MVPTRRSVGTISVLPVIKTRSRLEAELLLE
jgi:hypothetical protein